MRRENVRLSLSAIWPDLRYLSLGAFFAWVYLLIDFGAWMTGTDNFNTSVIDTSAWVYSVSAVVLFLSVFTQRAFRRFFALRFSGICIAGVAITGAALLILSGPRFFQEMELSRYLFQVGEILAGVGVALMTLQVGQLYCTLEPNRALLNALISELLVGVIFYIVIGNNWLQVIEGAPPLVGLLAVLLLPLAVVALASLPDSSQNQEAQTSPSQVRSSPESSFKDEAGLISSPRHFFEAMPAMVKLLLVVFVFVATASIVRNFFMFDRTPAIHQLDAQQAMLLRLLFSAGLLIAMVFFSHRFSLGRLYLFGMVVLGLVVVALPWLSLSESILLALISVLLEMMNLLVWCLLSFVSKRRGLQAFLTYGLGESCLHAGMAVGYLLGYYGILASLQTDDGSIVTPFAAALIILIFVCVVLIFTEKDFDSILEASGASNLNVKEAILRTRAGSSKEKDRPWRKACERVGARAQLSKREQEIFAELSVNRTPQEIAERLNITTATVRTHTNRIYVKLNVHSRAQLINLVSEEHESQKQK